MSDRVLLAVLRAEVPEKYGKKDPRPATKVKPITTIKIFCPSPRPPEPVLAAGPVWDLPAENFTGTPGPPPAPKPPRTPVKGITFITAPTTEPPRQEPPG